MPTITAGTVATVYCPLASTITITPGDAGRVSFQSRAKDGGQSAAPQDVYSATTVSVSAGDTVTMEAINTDATYTTPAGADTALSALVSGDGMAPYVKELRVATFGDSTAETGRIKATATTDQEFCDIALGTGTTTLSQTTRNGLPLFYPAAKLVAVGGVSGDTTTQMLAREAAAASTTRRSISDVVNIGPDLVIVRGGGVNDVIGMTTASTQADIDAVFERHMQAIDSLLATGVRVLDEGIQGYDATSGTPPAADTLAFRRAAIVQLNARYAAAIAQRDPRQIRWLETSGLTHDGTGKFLPGYSMTTDGTHLSQYGLIKVAEAEAEIVTLWFGTSASKSYIGQNLLNTSAASLALYPAVSSSGVGDTPTGFSSTASNTTRQNGAIVQRNGKRWWTLEAVPTGASPSLQMFLPFGVDAAATYQIPIVAGAQYGMEFDCFFETLDGSPLPSGFTFAGRIDLRNGSSGRLNYDLDSYASQQSPTDAADFLQVHMRFPPIQISDASADLTNASQWRLNVILVNGGPSIRVGIAGANIVKLT